MIEQRGTRCRPITEMHVDSLKGLKKRGTRGKGRQGKIGYEIIRSRDHGKLGMGILPQYLSLKVGAYVVDCRKRQCSLFSARQRSALFFRLLGMHGGVSPM